MTENFSFNDSIGLQIIKANNEKQTIQGFSDIFAPRGRYFMEHYRDGHLISEVEITNLITDAGKNYILNAGFNGLTPESQGSWSVGLITTASFSAIAAGDTASAHAGWSEFVGYSNATRPPWGPTTSTAKNVVNTTPATFLINASGTLKGIFIVSNNTKSGSTGVLWSAGTFPSDVPVADGDQIKITYAVAA